MLDRAEMITAVFEMLSGTPEQGAIILAIYAAARRHDLDPGRYYRQIWAESRFNPNAVGPCGELGLGQMNPKYWPTATLEVEANLELSAGYMRELLGRYEENYCRALAAYNYGPVNVNRLIEHHGSGNGWLSHLPQQTWHYVLWITGIEGG